MATAANQAPRIRPSLGTTLDEVLDGFKALDRQHCGRRITEAHLVCGPVYRWMAEGKLGIVVDEIAIRAATATEIAELEEGIELGQVQIQTKVRRMFESSDYQVAHQATGRPLDPNSKTARAYEARLLRTAAQR